jgi:hypothetical protein
MSLPIKELVYRIESLTEKVKGLQFLLSFWETSGVLPEVESKHLHAIIDRSPASAKDLETFVKPPPSDLPSEPSHTPARSEQLCSERKRPLPELPYESTYCPVCLHSYAVEKRLEDKGYPQKVRDRFAERLRDGFELLHDTDSEGS